MNLALFDLDETIIATDCSKEWMIWLVENNLANAQLLALNNKLMDEYYAGTVDIVKQIELTLEPIKYVEKKLVDYLVSQFIQEKISLYIYSKALKQIKWHQENGDCIILISASSTHLVEPIGNYLGIHQSFGCAAEMILSPYQQIVYSGKMIGEPTFQIGKTLRIKNWLKTQSNVFEQIFAYSDSINDRCLLEFADQSYTINPDKQFAKLAHEKNWYILNWQNTSSHI